VSEVLSLKINRLKTPIGEMLIVVDYEGNLRSADWTDHETRMRELLRRHYGENGFRLNACFSSTEVVCAIDRYFHGDLAAIDMLPVKTAGTLFQQEVWRALRAIACGSTTTYAKLAQQIGRPTSARAVGMANGSNPVGVVVPCHRVIGSNGSLTGYGGGIERKLWLLRHEACARR
jgi:methylated-DNA-[protein]-cysteine S-methyltransferase